VLLRSGQLLQDWQGSQDNGAVARAQSAERGVEGRDAAATTLLEKARAARGCLDSADAPVVRVDLALDESRRLERLDETGDRRRPDLLDGGERAEGLWAGEDEHGQRGELRRRETGGVILPPKAAEQMDGDRMEAIGGAGSGSA
jgi:hypothetical protein